MPARTATRREGPARTRILETASALFYAEGVHAVGVDRIIAEAGVAKATFYHHFPAKNDLVRAYVEEQSRRQRVAEAAFRQLPPREALVAVFDVLGDIASGADYRGCPFINTAAEYPDPADPVRAAIADHRRWFRGMLREFLVAAGHPDPDRTADILVLLKDGMALGCDLDDPIRLRALARDAVTRVLTP
ncbi:TetR/AcrR family transcriptional regulator [Actinomycetes bacterium KLBMP 9797]